MSDRFWRWRWFRPVASLSLILGLCGGVRGADFDRTEPFEPFIHRRSDPSLEVFSQHREREERQAHPLRDSQKTEEGWKTQSRIAVERAGKHRSAPRGKSSSFGLRGAHKVFSDEDQFRVIDGVTSEFADAPAAPDIPGPDGEEARKLQGCEGWESDPYDPGERVHVNGHRRRNEVCKMFITYPSGEKFVCSGSLVGTNLLMTARHCTANGCLGNAVDGGEVKVACGYGYEKGASDYAHFGVATIEECFFHPEFDADLSCKRGRSMGGLREWDIQVCRLSTHMGCTVGWLGTTTDDSEETTVVGYPGGSGVNGNLNKWGDFQPVGHRQLSRQAQTRFDEQIVQLPGALVFAGESGSPYYHVYGGARFVQAVHGGGPSGCLETGRRVTSEWVHLVREKRELLGRECAPTDTPSVEVGTGGEGEESFCQIVRYSRQLELLGAEEEGMVGPAGGAVTIAEGLAKSSLDFRDTPVPSLSLSVSALLSPSSASSASVVPSSPPAAVSEADEAPAGAEDEEGLPPASGGGGGGAHAPSQEEAFIQVSRGGSFGARIALFNVGDRPASRVTLRFFASRDDLLTPGKDVLLGEPVVLETALVGGTFEAFSVDIQATWKSGQRRILVAWESPGCLEGARNWDVMGTVDVAVPQAVAKLRSPRTAPLPSLPQPAEIPLPLPSVQSEASSLP
uniref:Peptidase S1 domain-containing protein n=1 Tax=Chromera velia CCMP2878 TaxID=1169474 RepID=A0A0G4GXB8_9ALVE|eukprot:Cvel_23803.t1-p1 / transcript=Cvel_23803.t1 / gene=Cvel_23803 / organism=Chromera_velia_CCMP2878 / gene_product=hypothetical protein / transcript_product=hypothetical protein / location=Cvel_scaffold2499:7350-9923(+) / protein_length=680 / sequence_SO=supercontig / SO=protein_coding / is_pseudo=false